MLLLTNYTQFYIDLHLISLYKCIYADVYFVSILLHTLNTLLSDNYYYRKDVKVYFYIILLSIYRYFDRAHARSCQTVYSVCNGRNLSFADFYVPFMLPSICIRAPGKLLSVRIRNRRREYKGD